MKKELVIVAKWEGEHDFQHLKSLIEKNISDIASFSYILWVKKVEKKVDLPEIKDVYYLTKKDFNLFRKLKNDKVRKCLEKTPNKALLIAVEKEFPALKRILKNSNLLTIGMANEDLPDFDISIQDTELKEGKFFKQLDYYLTKIQL